VGEKNNTLETEIQSWDRFEYALREENRILFQEMLDKCRKSEYFECVNAKGQNHSAELLFLILILEQQKMINELIAKLGDSSGSPTCHVSLYPVPFSINLAESLNSYATDGAFIIIAVRLRKTPKKAKNVERILLFIFYPLINTTGTSKFISCTMRGL
jgi:hypothetical protein